MDASIRACRVAPLVGRLHEAELSRRAAGATPSAPCPTTRRAAGAGRRRCGMSSALCPMTPCWHSRRRHTPSMQTTPCLRRHTPSASASHAVDADDAMPSASHAVSVVDADDAMPGSRGCCDTTYVPSRQEACAPFACGRRCWTPSASLDAVSVVAAEDATSDDALLAGACKKNRQTSRLLVCERAV